MHANRYVYMENIEDRGCPILSMAYYNFNLNHDIMNNKIYMKGSSWLVSHALRI